MSATAPRGDWREVVHVSWPLVVSMLSYTLMGLADTVMVAQLGTTEVAAVGIGATAYFAVACFGMGLLGGVRVIVAQATGAGEPHRGRRVAWQGVVIGLGLGLGLLLLLGVSDWILEVMGGGGAVSRLGMEYFDSRLAGAIGTFVGMAAMGWFEGQGETRLPMKIRLATNGLNVVLDWLLIFGFGPVPALGVAGAGYGTMIALLVQGVWAVWSLWLRTRSEREPFRWDDLRDLAEIGGPMGVQWALEVQSWAVFCAIIARVGEAHLAAHAIVVRIVSVSFLPGHAIGDGTSILTGQAFGADDLASARRSAHSAMWVALVAMGVLGLVFLLVPGLLLAGFEPAADVRSIGIDLLVVAAGFQLFDAVAMTRTGALNGMGDTRFVMLVGVGLAWTVLVPLAWLFCNVLGWGSQGAWWALTANIAALSAVLWARWSWLTRPEARLPTPAAAE